MGTGIYTRTEKHKKICRDNLAKRRSLPSRCEKCGVWYSSITKEHTCKKRIVSDETRWKQSETMRGLYKSNKLKPIRYWLGKKRDEETIKKVSEKNKLLYRLGLHRLNPKIKKGVRLNSGRTHFKKGQNVGEKNYSWKGGKPECVDCGKSLSGYDYRRCMGCAGLFFKGEKSHSWKGGLTPLNRLLRRHTNYNRWRKEVFERDNYTCRWCGLRGVYLHAHHIKSFAKYKDLIYDINNGITLCKKCHYDYHKKYGFKGE